MSSKKKTTMSDVAKQAGVSRMTVSRVINGHGGITQETLQRVRDVMREVHYIPAESDLRPGPNPKKPGRSGFIAFAAAGVYESVLRNDTYHDVSISVENALAMRDQAMIVRRLLPGSQKEFNLRGVDGAIVLGNPRLVKSVPLVQVLGPLGTGETWDHITYDDYTAGKVAADYLLKLGHRVCAVLGGSRGRQLGFTETLAQAGGEPISLNEKRNHFRASEQVHEVNPGVLSDSLDQLLACRPRPTGLFVGADMLTAALYPNLRVRGVEPGQDLAIVSCNNETSILSTLHPRPPSVDLHTRQIGEAAVEQLLKRLDNPTAATVALAFKPELHIPSETVSEPASEPLSEMSLNSTL